MAGQQGGPPPLGGHVSWRPWARQFHPDVALSHGSYSQVVAARLLRVPRGNDDGLRVPAGEPLELPVCQSRIVPGGFPSSRSCGALVRAPREGSEVRRVSRRSCTFRRFQGEARTSSRGHRRPDPRSVGGSDSPAGAYRSPLPRWRERPLRGARQFLRSWPRRERCRRAAASGAARAVQEHRRRDRSGESGRRPISPRRRRPCRRRGWNDDAGGRAARYAHIHRLRRAPSGRRCSTHRTWLHE